MTLPSLRPLSIDDYEPIASVVDDWWGGRPMRGLLQRLFFEHFRDTSFVAGQPGEVRAFLIGFVSQSEAGVAYIHFVGVDPTLRAAGLGRVLYERFFDTVRARGCREVRSITSPANRGSIAFHRRMGFELAPGTGVVDGVPVHLDHAGPGQHRVCFHKPIAPALS
ncbi:GNAT family N-acetyltransferase [Pigmentiphaga sp. GD03639]|uniref:GNAT family N-acetyltransferase n=1 Tax=unclassified Pigmentiphaga TaxID=2626614 RepID=UPI000B417F07|nr:MULTISPECIES: GNAT family N-acetyltransferase [unclassified Pigmentiphaga]MDH2234808.1 GNAT family N-acetyltransferase [Pigmentiphaga sp. GD03639]OVZ59575.1 GNAT family N-acetyltransferase [Pigmentiphaga sp. NML030171]